LLQDETCFFLAVDFDKAGWREDAAAFLETCHHLNIPAALERSRSGRGAHVWFFFDEAIPAALARRQAKKKRIPASSWRWPKATRPGRFGFETRAFGSVAPLSRVLANR
jgi:hypothetical protein